MVIFSLRCLFIILLLQSSGALRMIEYMHPNNWVRPIPDQEYPLCSSMVKKLPHDWLMFTYFISPQNSSDFIKKSASFSKDFDSCILCLVKENECLKIRNSANENLCTMTNIYLGPANENCVLPDDDTNIQMVFERKLIPRLALMKAPIESRWRIIPASEYFPKIFDIPIGGLKDNSVGRETRYAEACSFPNGLETASLKCRVYPSSVKCTQLCAFGYTLQSGIQQDMKCTAKENIWRPTGFTECQPFVDCTLALNSGGYGECSSIGVKTAPTCALQCLHYEDEDAVPLNTYTCDIEGKWSPPLPFCASPGQGLVLTSAPKKKLHDD